jgi:hypothetical protein
MLPRPFPGWELVRIGQIPAIASPDFEVFPAVGLDSSPLIQNYPYGYPTLVWTCFFKNAQVKVNSLERGKPGLGFPTLALYRLPNDKHD